MTGSNINLFGETEPRLFRNSDNTLIITYLLADLKDEQKRLIDKHGPTKAKSHAYFHKLSARIEDLETLLYIGEYGLTQSTEVNENHSMLILSDLINTYVDELEALLKEKGEEVKNKHYYQARLHKIYQLKAVYKNTKYYHFHPIISQINSAIENTLFADPFCDEIQISLKFSERTTKPQKVEIQVEQNFKTSYLKKLGLRMLKQNAKKLDSIQKQLSNLNPFKTNQL